MKFDSLIEYLLIIDHNFKIVHNALQFLYFASVGLISILTTFHPIAKII